jgi:hypothetical protein
VDDDIPEDKLLEMPEKALPGNLAHRWTMCSNLLHQREPGELNHELSGNAYPSVLLAWADPIELRKPNEAMKTRSCLIRHFLLSAGSSSHVVWRDG